MDPVSVFNALFDTKCLKFGHYTLKSGLVAPYYINLRRLPLYPELLDAVVTQVVEKFLTNQALVSTTSQIRRRSAELKIPTKTTSSNSVSNEGGNESTINKGGDNHNRVSSAAAGPSPVVESDADSQLEEDDTIETSSCEDSCECEKVRGENLDPILCGVPWGAVPLASAIAYKAQLPYLLERKETKSYGDHQPLMEDFNQETRQTVSNNKSSKGNNGMDNKQQRVILIEDVICSGESILSAVHNLAKQNLKVEFVICIVDREENGINLLLEQAGIHVLTLYNMSAILRILETTGRITSKQFIHTRQWMADNKFTSIGINPTNKSLTGEQLHLSLI